MSAIFSPCGLYRYRLERTIAPAGITAMALLVNPSIADHEKNDATVVKLIGFGLRNGIARWLLGNKFAFKSTDIKGLRTTADPIGPDNDIHIRAMMAEADMLIAGWGSLAKLPEVLRGRWKDIVKMADEAGKPLHCIGTGADKHPTHPLMTAYDIPITPWKAPWFPNRKRQHEPTC